MKTEDLMVGDWFMSKGHPAQVVMILKGGYYDEVRLKNKLMFYDIQIPKYLEPIPLTNEILEKNGIAESIIDGVFYESISGRSITRQDDFYYMDGIIAVELRYVHELQHALRLLKIDKEIEL